MNITQQIQIAVARADLLLCRLAAIQWKRLAVSLLLAALVIHTVKAVIRNER